MDNLDRVVGCLDTLQTQKDKLKGLVRYSRKELKRSKRKLKETSLESLNKNDKIEELQRTISHLKEKIKLQEDKLKYYKKQEMEMSLVKSFKSNVSDDLNMKLINQNQEILDRFYKEEERVRELEEENERLQENQKKKETKIMKLQNTLKQLREKKEKEENEGEVKDLKAEIVLLNRIKDRQEEDEQKLKERMKIVQIERDTYEKKLNELIDEHNNAVEKYEKQLDMIKGEMNRDNMKRRKETKELRKVFDSSNTESSKGINQLKESLINKRILESEIQTLKAENAQLKLEMLSVKQKHMTLMNRYSILKKRIKQGRLLMNK
jgi:chromosome segregation ATPase